MKERVANIWKHRYGLLLRVAIVMVAIMLFVYFIAIPLYMETHEAEYTVTVTDKEYTGGRTLYLVFTEDAEGRPFVFENHDSYVRGKVNSSDVQELIRVGKTYTFKAVGYRWHYLRGWYPNIIAVEEVP